MLGEMFAQGKLIGVEWWVYQKSSNVASSLWLMGLCGPTQ